MDAVRCFFLAAQGEHAVGQDGEALVGSGNDLLEVVLLHIGLEGQLGPAVAASLAGAAIVQISDDRPVLLFALALALCGLNLLVHVFVQVDLGRCSLFIGICLFLRTIQLCLMNFKRREIHHLFALELLLQLG